MNVLHTHISKIAGYQRIEEIESGGHCVGCEEK